ncbi:MAG: hypothetical protein M2R45_03656 [Verrucomicrobia subdivision 3 bacterium]|nr:hypothetical protein [Limisphaerales bacterium]MCS1412715.1 hypothetical protein [Limisphaerales bacterium]
MPTLFPDGKSVNEDVFDGERQIQAMWDFLEIAGGTSSEWASSRDEGARGRGKAVMYRNFIEDSGLAPTGLGYPGKGQSEL